MSSTSSTIHSWGGQVVPGRERLSEDLRTVAPKAPLTRGLGRAYGDAAFPPDGQPLVAGSRLADRVLGFEEETGLFRGEAGLCLFDLNRLLWPRGWAVPVSPGTQFVTLGGMVAADVHGKNHHGAGTIGRHVERLVVQLASGEVVECSRSQEAELFLACLGGMGLPAHILEVSLRLERIPSAWIESWSRRFESVQELAVALTEVGRDWPFTAAWLDGLRADGRGILLCGRWAESAERAVAQPRDPRLSVPFQAPSWLLNRASVGAFNLAYWHRHWTRERSGVAHPQAFYYPLDGVRDWNRLYGRRGFLQYQCVLPAELGAEAVSEFLTRLRSGGGTPFLIVLKDFGAEGEGLLSFPRSGFTLAVDLPRNAGSQDLVDGLNEWLLSVGGRIYLAKDLLTRREHFAAMEGDRLERFASVRDRFDPERRLRSRQSVRLMGDPE